MPSSRLRNGSLCVLRAEREPGSHLALGRFGLRKPAERWVQWLAGTWTANGSGDSSTFLSGTRFLAWTAAQKGDGAFEINRKVKNQVRRVSFRWCQGSCMPGPAEDSLFRPLAWICPRSCGCVEAAHPYCPLNCRNTTAPWLQSNQKSWRCCAFFPGLLQGMQVGQKQGRNPSLSKLVFVVHRNFVWQPSCTWNVSFASFGERCLGAKVLWTEKGLGPTSSLVLSKILAGAW